MKSHKMLNPIYKDDVLRCLYDKHGFELGMAPNF